MKHAGPTPDGGFAGVGLKGEWSKGKVIHIVSTIRTGFSIVSQAMETGSMQGSSLGLSFMVQGTWVPELGKIM